MPVIGSPSYRIIVYVIILMCLNYSFCGRIIIGIWLSIDTILRNFLCLPFAVCLCCKVSLHFTALNVLV